MDFATNTEQPDTELKITQENNLLELIKEICSEPTSKLSSKLRSKVTRIIADCDLKHYSSLHKVSAADESTSTLLGFMHRMSAEISFDEQAELNDAIIHKIKKKLPTCIKELEELKRNTENYTKLREENLKALQERDNKLDVLKEQEIEKMELMIEWLNQRIQGVSKFSENTGEVLATKAKILDLKSKILHLQILQSILTETNQSIKAYANMHKDLSDSIKDTEERIKNFRQIINNDDD